MSLPNWARAVALSVPSLVGLLILAYAYGAPGLARVPSGWNIFVGRYLLLACLLGGTVTAIFGLAFLKRAWDELDPVLKTMTMVINLGWLAMVLYIVLHGHGRL
jgi:hypothetical protein